MIHPHIPDPDPHLAHDAGDDLPAEAPSVHLHHQDALPTFAEAAGAADTAAGEVVGTPDDDAGFWQPQTTAFTCAVMAQRGVIEAMTGEDVSEAQLVYEATADGCLSDGGMSPYDVGRLLDDHQVPNHVVDHGTVGDLVAELSLGHKVIVGVDAGELWDTDFALEDFFGQAADHAIWVTGIDDSDPAHPQVIVNDSGDPQGAGRAYDLDRFVNAWADSGFFYVATDHAPADYAAVCPAYDPALGHIPALAAYFSQHTSGFDQRLQELAGATDSEAATASEPPMVDRDAFLRSV